MGHSVVQFIEIKTSTEIIIQSCPFANGEIEPAALFLIGICHSALRRSELIGLFVLCSTRFSIPFRAPAGLSSASLVDYCAIVHSLSDQSL